MIAYIGSDMLVHFTAGATLNLESGESTPLDAAALVTFRVQTLDYVDVPGETWPLVMSYIPNSAGHFIGLLRRTVALEAGGLYRFVATADNGTDQDAVWDLPLLAQTRDE